MFIAQPKKSFLQHLPIRCYAPHPYNRLKDFTNVDEVVNFIGYMVFL